MDRHIAQINVARMRATLDHPCMASFAAMLDDVNAAADEHPGFVWRLQTDAGNATSMRVYGDPRILVNMSVWESLDDLREYTYRGMHRGPLRRRREWFLRDGGPEPHLALWWVDPGHRPTVEEGIRRLEILREQGPGPEAFTFRSVVRPVAEVPPDGGILRPVDLPGPGRRRNDLSAGPARA